MSDPKVTTARVRVTIDIEIPSTWGDDCKLDQVRAQSIETALGMIRNGLVVNGMQGAKTPSGIARTVGEPQVTAIFVECKS